MRHHVRVHIFLVLAVILLALVLAPVAAAERAVVVAGTGTGEGLGSSTGQVRIHFNSNVGGELWVSTSFPDSPEFSGTFHATIDKDQYLANGDGFATVPTVVASDNPSFPVGAQFLFFCMRVDGGFYVLTGEWMPFFLDRGNISMRL
jgi:hypothetical protein